MSTENTVPESGTQNPKINNLLMDLKLIDNFACGGLVSTADGLSGIGEIIGEGLVDEKYACQLGCAIYTLGNYLGAEAERLQNRVSHMIKEVDHDQL